MSESWICTVCGTENLDNRDHCWKCSSVKGASSENQQPLSSQPAERKEPRVDVAPEQAGKQIKEIGASRELSKSEIDEKNTKMKQQWILMICLGLLLLIFGCAMEVNLFNAINQEPAKTGFGFVIILGLYLIFRKKPSKKAAEIELEKEKVLQSPMIQDERVITFFQTTITAWSNGKLASLNDKFKTGSIGKQPQDFIKVFPPYKGSPLRAFFDDFKPLNGEFLVGNTDSFVLTNFRLIQKDSNDNKFKEIILADVNSFKIISGFASTTLRLQMNSGEKIIFKKCAPPNDKYLSLVVKQRIVA